MINSYGFDGQFVKRFMNHDRSAEEVISLIETIQKWQKSTANLIEESIHSTLVIALDKLAKDFKIKDFYHLLDFQSKKNLGKEKTL